MNVRDTVVVPILDHDLKMEQQYGHKLLPRECLERRIVAALIAHLGAKGWAPWGVDDTEDHTPVRDAKSAMEVIFSADLGYLFLRNKEGATHYVMLVGGNGQDIISDWSYAEGDTDGFSAAMDSFNVEAYY
jgi:hypothetical protein